MRKMWDEIAETFTKNENSNAESSVKCRQTKQDKGYIKRTEQLARQLDTFRDWLSSHYKMPVPGWKDPEAIFVGFADSSINLQLNLYVDDIRLNHFLRKARAVTEVAEEISMRFAQGIKVEGAEKPKPIEIPFPQTDIHIKN
jgi:small-conductance mechanosensitive channel